MASMATQLVSQLDKSNDGHPPEFCPPEVEPVEEPEVELEFPDFAGTAAFKIILKIGF